MHLKISVILLLLDNACIKQIQYCDTETNFSKYQKKYLADKAFEHNHC